ncbi:hypothetical protein CEP49_08180 [Mergibacter septicus]|uniref:hypothetical protein n=1 Tax=Mergibacter septicus TaxID=221402 RepID=UPI0011794386|nr:hypothetical protein [Mergibacter septicus]AWX14504.1 hypothetical protein CEP49_08180 [Mergibacter septicus]
MASLGGLNINLNLETIQFQQAKKKINLKTVKQQVNYLKSRELNQSLAPLRLTVEQELFMIMV